MRVLGWMHLHHRRLLSVPLAYLGFVHFWLNSLRVVSNLVEQDLGRSVDIASRHHNFRNRLAVFVSLVNLCAARCFVFYAVD